MTTMDADILETRIAKMRVGLRVHFESMRLCNGDSKTGIVYAALHELAALDDGVTWHDFLRDALEEVLFMARAK